MSLKWIEGFDYWSIAQLVNAGMYPISNGGNLEIVAGRNGNALRANGSSGELKIVYGGTSPTSVLGLAFKIPSLPNSGWPLINMDEGLNRHISVRINDSGHLVFTRNGTTLVVGATPIGFNTWYHLEMQVVIADSGGTLEAHLNGALEALFTGDTRNGGSGFVDTVTLRGWSNMDFDDLFIFDEAGFHGDCKVETLRPSAAGAHTDFTPSAGSNWQNVDDATPDEDSTYNVSASAGAKDSFALSDLLTPAGSVLGVQQVLRHRKDDAGSRTIRGLIRTGGSDYSGGDAAVSDSYSVSQRVIELNPATSIPWTMADVNALEAGYELVS